jgi:hypothetical protein
MAKTMSPEQINGLYKSLATKTYLQTGLDYGFDKYYKDKRGVINRVSHLRSLVLENPDKYGVSEEVRDMVESAIASRRDERLDRTQKSLAEKTESLNEMDIKELVTGVRDKAWKLMHKKLDRAMKSKKEMDKINLGYLNTVAGTAFDKSQILKGEATESIVIYGKFAEGEVTPAMLHEMSRQVLQRQQEKK